jgi:hypothetical protein
MQNEISEDFSEERLVRAVSGNLLTSGSTGEMLDDWRDSPSGDKGPLGLGLLREQNEEKLLCRDAV